MIELEKFLQEVSTETPCGASLEYDPAFIELERSIQGKQAQTIGDTVVPVEGPKWPDVKAQSLGLLAQTKDLRVVMVLIRALIHTDGYGGLNQGLALLRGVLDQYWETIHPQLDPDDHNDPTTRINILSSLCHFETMVCAVREIPLVTSRALGTFSLRDLGVATGKIPQSPESAGSPVEMATIDAAFLDKDVPPAELQATSEAVREGIDHLQAINITLEEKVGTQNAPELKDLVDVLKEAHQVISQQLVRRGAPGSSATPAEGRAPEGGPSSQVPASGPMTGGITSRADVEMMLDKACEYFRTHEPSSPVPMLLKRAKGLIAKDFMEILRDVAPKGVSDAEVIRGPEN